MKNFFDGLLTIVIILFIVGLVGVAIYSSFFAPCQSFLIRYSPAANVPARCLNIIK